MMDCARRWTAASLIGVGRSISNGQSCLQVCRWTKASGYSTGVHKYCHLGRERACGGVVKIIGRSKNWLIEGQTATGTMARCTLTSQLHYHAIIKVEQPNKTT